MEAPQPGTVLRGDRRHRDAEVPVTDTPAGTPDARSGGGPADPHPEGSVPASPSAGTEEQPAKSPDEVPFSHRVSFRTLPAQLWDPAYRRAATWSIPLVVLAYGFAMTNFTLAGDDWFTLFPQSTLDTRFSLGSGRWMMPLTWWVLGNGSFVPFFTFAVALVLLVLAGLVACAAWGFRRPAAVFAVVTLFVVNPMFTDMLNFKQHHLSFTIGLGCASVAGWALLWWDRPRLRRLAVVAALLVLSFASYQPTALAFVVVLMGHEVLSVSKQGRGYLDGARARWLDTVVASVAAVVVYLVSVRVAWTVTGTNLGSVIPYYRLTGGYPSTPGQLVDVVWHGARTTGVFWLRSTTLYPIALKVVSLVVMAIGVTVAVRMVARVSWRTPVGAYAARAWVLFLGVGSLVVPFAVLFVRDLPPMRGNVFVTVGLVVGFWGGLAVEHVRALALPRLARPVEALATTLVIVAVLIGAHEINRGFFGLYLSNQRDLANATRMLSVIEQMPQFRAGRPVEVELAGLVEFAGPAAPFSNALAPPGTSSVNCSGLACKDRLVNMFNLISGGDRLFVRGSVSQDPAFETAVSRMPPWPRRGSIDFIDGVFVIKGS